MHSLSLSSSSSYFSTPNDKAMLLLFSSPLSLRTRKCRRGTGPIWLYNYNYNASPFQHACFPGLAFLARERESLILAKQTVLISAGDVIAASSTHLRLVSLGMSAEDKESKWNSSLRVRPLHPSLMVYNLAKSSLLSRNTIIYFSPKDSYKLLNFNVTPAA